MQWQVHAMHAALLLLQQLLRKLTGTRWVRGRVVRVMAATYQATMPVLGYLC